jgi:tRNA threonylcarbamoyladenosine biosynthesis protein TsaE
MNSEWIYTLDEIDTAAQWLLDQLTTEDILLIEAPMGSGKTTLISALMHLIGVVDEVSSPTYAIVNEYMTKDPVFRQIYHMDLYRLEHMDDLENLPIEAYLDQGGLILCEWPELLEKYLGEGFKKLKIETLSSNSRKLVLL